MSLDGIKAFNKNYNLPCETLISHAEDKVCVSLFVPAECSFFDGHFPEFKLLPAVGQFAIVSHLASKYLGLAENVSKIKRMKFSAPVTPDTTVKIELEADRKRKEVSFLITDADDSAVVYSSGKFA